MKRRVLLLLVAALVRLMVAVHSTPALAQPTSEHFWLAGRYDWNRVVIYFGAVKFGNKFPSDAHELAPGHFSPYVLSPSYVAKFQKAPGAEHFAIGDHYDLLLGGRRVAPVTLNTLLGFPGDEGVGNDSYIGALATVDRQGGLFAEKDYYAVTRHGTVLPADLYSGLLNEPVRFDIQNKSLSSSNSGCGQLLPLPCGSRRRR